MDRDNFIVHDNGYVHDIKELKIINGFIEFAFSLQIQGFSIFIVTNQAGIARGYFDESDSLAFNKRLIFDLKKFGVNVLDFEFCPHHPKFPLNGTSHCYCRKPNPGMIYKLAEKHDIVLNRSIICGDQLTDAFSGVNAGLRHAFCVDASRTEYHEKIVDTEFSIVANYDRILNLLNKHND